MSGQWSWSPERLKIVENVEFEWNKLPLNSYENSIIQIRIDGSMTIFSGYVWDGATAVPTGKYLKDSSHLPVVSLTSKPVPSEWYATLRHDACYEYMYERDNGGRRFPYSREDVDKQFYIDLKTNRFRYSKLYYWGVKLFGGIYSRGALVVRRVIAIFN